MENITQARKITRVAWKDTLKAMRTGESARFSRKEITVSNLRTTVSKLKKEGYVFRVQSVDSDDYAIVTRER